jgi:hypothetical protein
MNDKPRCGETPADLLNQKPVQRKMPVEFALLTPQQQRILNQIQMRSIAPGNKIL